jgi:HEAT repeat protein
MLRQGTEETVEHIEESLETVLLEIVKQLGQAIRMRGFYPKGHAAVGAALSRLKEGLEPVLAGEREITIGSAGDSLLYGGKAFGASNKPARKLAEYLKVRDISGLTFKQGVRMPELENAVEVLSEGPDIFASPDSPLLREGAQTDHVHFRQIHFDRILRHVSEEEAQFIPVEEMDGIWRSVIQDDLAGNLPLTDQAKTMIEESVQDRATFRQMTGQLVKASEKSGGDTTDTLAKGVRKTCEALAGLTGEKRSDGLSFLSEVLQEMDPEVALRLVGEQEEGKEGTQGDGQKLVLELTQSLPVAVKMGVLAALVRSKRNDSSRVSSVFGRIAGVEKRKRELLKEIEREADAPSETKEAAFQMVWSAVQDLVLHEFGEKFVDSEYASMLETFGEESGSVAGDTTVETSHVKELRRGLEPSAILLDYAESLTDLAALQDEIPKLRMTLDRLSSACAELTKKGELGGTALVISDFTVLIAEYGEEKDERFELLRGCLQSLLNDETARPALEKLVGEEDGNLLNTALEALGDASAKYVCELAARSDEALRNERIASYLKANAAASVAACEAALNRSPAPHSKRLLKVLAFLNTDEAIDCLVFAAGHPDQNVQTEAVKALGRSRNEKANDFLHLLLAGGDQRLAISAAIALGETGSAEVANSLCASLRRLDPFGRRIQEVIHTAAALGGIKEPAAVPHLERLLNRRLFTFGAKKKRLREAAAMALESIASDEALAVLERGASRRNKQVREACAKALALHEHKQKNPKEAQRESEIGSE